MKTLAVIGYVLAGLLAVLGVFGLAMGATHGDEVITATMIAGAIILFATSTIVMLLVQIRDAIRSKA